MQRNARLGESEHCIGSDMRNNRWTTSGEVRFDCEMSSPHSCSRWFHR